MDEWGRRRRRGESAGGGAGLTEREYLEANLTDGAGAILSYHSFSENGGSFVTSTGGVVDNVADVFGVAPPIVFAGTARPAWDDTNLQAVGDGVNDYGTTGAYAPYELVGAKAVVYFGTLEDGDTIVNISNSTRFMRIIRNSGDSMITGSYPGSTASAGVVVSTTRRLILIGKDGGNPFNHRAEIPDHTAGANSDAAMTAGSNELRLFAFASATAPASGKCRAVLVLNRDYTAGDKTVLKALGAAYHSIVLAA